MSVTFEFDSTIGNDIDVVVTGTYDAPDRSVGYQGSFWIEKVTLPGSKVDLSSLLMKHTEDRLEDQGMYKYQQSKEVENVL